jgi:hypothetical protein
VCRGDMGDTIMPVGEGADRGVEPAANSLAGGRGTGVGCRVSGGGGGGELFDGGCPWSGPGREEERERGSWTARPGPGLIDKTIKRGRGMGQLA